VVISGTCIGRTCARRSLAMSIRPAVSRSKRVASELDCWFQLAHVRAASYYPESVLRSFASPLVRRCACS
jgi:hypothetical protein